MCACYKQLQHCVPTLRDAHLIDSTTPPPHTTISHQLARATQNPPSSHSSSLYSPNSQRTHPPHTLTTHIGLAPTFGPVAWHSEQQKLNVSSVRHMYVSALQIGAKYVKGGVGTGWQKHMVWKRKTMKNKYLITHWVLKCHGGSDWSGKLWGVIAQSQRYTAICASVGPSAAEYCDTVSPVASE